MKTTLGFLVLLFFLLLGAATSQAVVFSSRTPTQGPNCASTFPIRFIVSSNTLVAGTYTVTLTDSASVAHSPLSAPVLTFTVPQHVDVDFDLSACAGGPATLSITPPSGPVATFGFAINPCSGGMVIELSSSSAFIAPNPLTTDTALLVSVINYSLSASVPAVVNVDGIPLVPDATMNAPGSGPGGTPFVSQGFTFNVPALPPGGIYMFPFFLHGGVSGVGMAFTVIAQLGTPYLVSANRPMTIVASLDPNAKAGPVGIGTAHYINGNGQIAYQIGFENDPFASAPAQQVVVTDRLDVATLDVSSFLFGPMVFSNVVVIPPFAVNPFSVTVPYTVSSYVGPTNILVRVDGNLDADPFSPTYGEITWNFQTLDVDTSLPHPDPLIGFLPANNMPPEGQGAVSFLITPFPGLVTDNTITNRASIVFDLNPPLLTAIWTNTIVKLTPPFTIAPAAGNQVKITWASWILQESATLDGPWADAAVQVSPWLFTPSETNRFYRLRTP